MTNLDKNNPSNKASNTSSNRKTPSKVTSLETKQKSKQNTPKKFTLANINKLASKFNEKRKVYIDIDGEEFEVLLDENFRKTTIQRVVVDYLKFLYVLKSTEGIDEEAVLSSTILLDVLVLKHFTNLPIPDVDDVSKLIKIAQNLVDLGIVNELLGEGKNSFSKENIDLVREQTNKALENMGKTLGELGLIAELNEAEKNRVDIDNYFSELEMRNFNITEDEDLSMLLKVIDQMNADGTYEGYMSNLTSEQMDKLDERLKMLEENKAKDNDNNEEA